MHELITDPVFDYNKTKEYKLSIQVSLDGFSFSVIHREENRLIALLDTPVTISSPKFIPSRLDEWLGSQEIIGKSFAEVQVHFFSEKFTLVPAGFYDANYQYDLFRVLFGSENGFQVAGNYLDHHNLHLLFDLPVNFSAGLDSRLENYSLLHPVSTIAAKIPAFDEPEKNGAALVFGKDNFDVVFFREGKMLFANHFRYEHPNDVIYYIITALQQYGFNREKTNLFLQGEILEKDEISIQLKKYFPAVRFVFPGLNFNPEIFKMPVHRFISHF